MIPLTSVSVGKVGPSQIDLDTDQVIDLVTDQVTGLVTDQVSNTKKETATDDTAR
jgi:hypothetical protein